MPIIDYVSKRTIESISHPGVKVTLHKCSTGRRDKLLLKLASQESQLRDFQLKIARFTTMEEPDFTADDTADLNTIIRSIEAIQRHCDAEYVRWGVAKIEGINIDGQPATADSLIDDGPPELTAEVVAECRKLTGLDAEERKNSQSPTTSDTSEDGRTSDSTVSPASNPAPTDPATAPDTSPTK